MITIGQIDIKNQYSHKRKVSHSYNHYETGGSLDKGKLTYTQNNSIIKPLQESVQTQISFKGFKFGAISKTFNPEIKKIPQKLTKKVFDSLEKISKEQFDYYSEIRTKYVSFIKENESFRRKNGISDEIAQSLTKDDLIYIPKKKLKSRFIEQVISPFKITYSNIQKLFTNKNSPANIIKKENAEIINQFSSLEGLINSHEIWENGYRKASGNTKWTENSGFLIPDDALLSKIKRRRNKVVDPHKGKYSSNSLMLGNRLISGIVYSYFLGTDAYNTTMRYSNDKHEAGVQRQSRIAQEFSRIVLNMYILNFLLGTFEAAVNKSLLTAMFVSGSTVAFSEILGRKLVGKPIMPSDKDTLDRREKEMSEKKGVLPAIGRLLTQVKKRDIAKNAILEAKTKEKTVLYEKKEPNKVLYSAFSKNNAPSFKGYFKVEKLFDKKKLEQITKIIGEADPKEYENIKETIINAAKKSEFFKKTMEEIKQKSPEKYKQLKFITEKPTLSKEELNNAFNKIIDTDEIKVIPMGEKSTPWGLLTKSIFVPFNFVKNLFKSGANNIRKIYLKVTGNKDNKMVKELEKFMNSPEKEIEAKKFNEFYLSRLDLRAWKESSLNAGEKRLRIFSEFKDIESKNGENIEGVKNILLWLDKQITAQGIKINSDNTLNPKDITKVKNLMKQSVLKADESKHLEYDGNKLSQTNINLARAITTVFLVTDAYNLTMQYSGDNKKDANKSAKNRAAQEASRIGLSAYMLAFVHNLLSKLCNSNLAGAFTLTALTSTVNDSLSRKVVGVPLTVKNQNQLQQIDKENSKSKSPIKKALAYSLGKKSAIPPQSKKAEGLDYFANDFFINPEIS